jgi:hypothetical protein
MDIIHVFNNLDALINNDLYNLNIVDTINIKIISSSDDNVDYKTIVSVVLTLVSIIGGYLLNQVNQNRINKKNNLEIFKKNIIKYGQGVENYEELITSYLNLTKHTRIKIDIKEIQNIPPDLKKEKCFNIVKEL